ncbi:SCO2525 family SAM-dependent methyltransferase [Phytohabitans aurantiacus]|jgi:hypothetical protein|uniref:Methyltransferase n=1 Tax=Phytohabitans aurantiacus TaxID=3016789 RepID=A0ABQ5R3S0_9ACTN|nr:SCO2525 family SAM-dependent methyltransferase [Phytohabitans aurantiacus]GLI01193.1 hypothetical protein Pa4123_64690 [Phytohabitans aurantiacus]
MSLTDSQARPVRLAAPPANADCPWELFDPDRYLQHNYGELRPPDQTIIKHVGRFFAAQRALRERSGRQWHGIDVGSGTNLYPALAMLPLASTITLWEHSATNVAWLERETRPYRRSWEPFWGVLVAAADMYRRLARPDEALSAAVKVEKASVFHLPEAQWDMGTMFFVAESITGRRAEFESATRRFLRSLKPGAPFVAAFMENSRGYSVGDQQFPAVAITERDLRPVLRELTSASKIHHIAPQQQLRDGYDGMILVTGITRAHPSRRFLVLSGVGTRLVRALRHRSR